MAGGFADLDSLSRERLLAFAHDYMLSGFHAVKATNIGLAMRAGLDDEAATAVSIDQWMGVSPVYTLRMKRLMGIEGDDVTAIMKALQLDVGFCHEYMDVAYKVIDANNAEFWLRHCGALIDIEPIGETQVFNMCHTIEDPTFDATALATNPRARIRPIHRPPRVPADREPHCHWTLTIDPANDPVGRIPLTERMANLPLSSVPNAIEKDNAGPGRNDYRSPFDPDFRLRELGNGALAAAAREFQMQAHLLAASFEESVASRIGRDATEAIMDEAWLGASWTFAERLPRLMDVGEGADAVAAALRVTSMVPPGFERSVTADGDRVVCTLEATSDGLLDPAHPGWCGSLARGATELVEGTAGGLGQQASVVAGPVEGRRIRLEATIGEAAPDRTEPDIVALGRIGRTSNWSFDLSDTH